MVFARLVAPTTHLEPANGVEYTATYDITENANIVPKEGTIIIEGTTTIQ